LRVSPNSIEGFTKKYKVHRLVYYESFDYVLNAIRREKQLKGWRREKKIALIEKDQPALAGPLRTVETRNAVPGTTHQENSLTRHWL
jgi:putative endonuclease